MTRAVASTWPRGRASLADSAQGWLSSAGCRSICRPPTANGRCVCTAFLGWASVREASLLSVPASPARAAARASTGSCARGAATSATMHLDQAGRRRAALVAAAARAAVTAAAATEGSPSSLSSTAVADTNKAERPGAGGHGSCISTESASQAKTCKPASTSRSTHLAHRRPRPRSAAMEAALPPTSPPLHADAPQPARSAAAIRASPLVKEISGASTQASTRPRITLGASSHRGQ